VLFIARGIMRDWPGFVKAGHGLPRLDGAPV
jgi:hypothetical protein